MWKQYIIREVNNIIIKNIPWNFVYFVDENHKHKQKSTVSTTLLSFYRALYIYMCTFNLHLNNGQLRFYSQANTRAIANLNGMKLGRKLSESIRFRLVSLKLNASEPPKFPMRNETDDSPRLSAKFTLTHKTSHGNQLNNGLKNCSRNNFKYPEYPLFLNNRYILKAQNKREINILDAKVNIIYLRLLFAKK